MIHHATKIGIMALISATCILSGCIKAEPTLILKADGSGTFDAEYSISEQSISRFKTMTKLRDALGAASGHATVTDDLLTMIFFDPSEKTLKPYFARYKKAGLEVDKVSVQTKGSDRHVHIRLKFEKFSTLAKTDLFSSNGMTLERNKQGDYVLRRRGVRTIDPSSGLSDTGYASAAHLLRGFNVTLRVNTPGMILRSNANKTSRFTAQWNFDFDRNPNALTELHKKLLEITFSGENVTL